MTAVVCKLPRAGLGNRLFPLMKALVLSKLNSYPCLITGYREIRPWHYLRPPGLRRSYSGYFNFEKGIARQSIDAIKAAWWLTTHNKEEDAPLQVHADPGTKKIYYYSRVPDYTDYFGGLKEYRPLVRNLFAEIVKEPMKQQATAFPDPVIGVHIRMGDFKKLQANEDFSKIGQARTPETYFIDIIKQIREISKTDLPVSVFTDGLRSEFRELFDLPAINMIEGNTGLVDMILLSRSKIIIASASSTFGYWAGFLSDAPLIMHPDHMYAPIRKAEEGLYEGPMDSNNTTLVKAIRSIRS